MPQAEPGKFLRQVGTGRVYGWTERLAKRKDFVDIDTTIAESRMEATREQLEQRLASLKNPKRLANAKQRIETITKLAKELTIIEKDLTIAEDTERREAVQAATGEPPVQMVDEKAKEINAAAMEEVRQGKILGENSEYQKVLAMKDKKSILDYLLSSFGERGDARNSIENLRFITLTKLKARIFETPKV
jgi:hypothetical protein